MAEAKRRGYGEDGIYFDHRGDCRDSDHHKTCAGRWRGVVSLGFDVDGKRIRSKVSGQTKAEVKDKLRALHSELDAGIRTTAAYTVAKAMADWLDEGLPGRSAKTIEVNRDSLRPLLAVIGPIPLRDLTVQDVRTALKKMAATHATRTLQKAHNCLTRAVRHAEGQDLVRRNVSALVDTPRGREGRPSQSLTVTQASALLGAAEDSRLHAYIVLCLLTGVRSEEARALTWDHVDLDAGTVSVWRSVRAHGDTKTERSRRTLKLPEIAVEALRAQLARQVEERADAGELWQEHGLVFTTTVGTPYESHNLRRDFRRVTMAAGIGARWVPKELRTSFVSMMSYRGVPVEEIARLAGHASSRTTEVIYRRELRPVITTGAEVMDQIFRPKQQRGHTATAAGLGPANAARGSGTTTGLCFAAVHLSAGGGGMTTNSAGYAGESPETRHESIDEQVKRKGIRPVDSVEDMAQDGVFESDEELEQFLAHVYAARHADLA